MSCVCCDRLSVVPSATADIQLRPREGRRRTCAHTLRPRYAADMYVLTALEGCFTSGCLCTQLAPGTVAPRTGYAADQEGSLTFDGLCGSVSFSDDRTDTSCLICSRHQEGSFGVYGSGSSSVHFYSRKILTNHGYDKSSSDEKKTFAKMFKAKSTCQSTSAVTSTWWWSLRVALMLQVVYFPSIRLDTHEEIYFDLAVMLHAVPSATAVRYFMCVRSCCPLAYPACMWKCWPLHAWCVHWAVCSWSLQRCVGLGVSPELFGCNVNLVTFAFTHDVLSAAPRPAWHSSTNSLMVFALLAWCTVRPWAGFCGLPVWPRGIWRLHNASSNVHIAETRSFLLTADPPVELRVLTCPPPLLPGRTARPPSRASRGRRSGGLKKILWPPPRAPKVGKKSSELPASPGARFWALGDGQGALNPSSPRGCLRRWGMHASLPRKELRDDARHGLCRGRRWEELQASG